MSSYLITGSSGLICSAVVAELKAQCDAIVYVAGRNVESLRRQFGSEPRLTFVQYDATKPFECDYNVDYVIHGASAASPELFVSSPVETMWANVYGVRELLEYVRRGGAKKLVYISSSEVYGRIAPRETGFVEADYGFVDVLSPRSSYPMGKRAAETLCASYVSEYGVDVSIARPGHIYGPTCSSMDRRVSSAFAWQAARGEDIVMKSAGTSVRSYTHCADCARAILTVCEKGLNGEAYNIANREGACSIRRMAEILATAGGVKLKIDCPNAEELAAFNPMDNSCLDPTKLESLGWRGTIGPVEGFSQTVSVLRSKLKETGNA